MVSNNECRGSGDSESVPGEPKGRLPLHVSASKKSLISGENSQSGGRSGVPAVNRLKYLQFASLESPTAKFQNLAHERDEASRAVPSSTDLHIRERFRKLINKKIDWDSLWRMCKEWIRDPSNMAFFIWIICVAVSGAFLFMIMTGMLNRVLPRRSQRDTWFEVNNQILNALFTLMCLYQHPKRLYHLALLLRWRPEDVVKLRKVYCKNGTYKPNEWMHMMVVVFFLNLNCFAQYALCGLNLGYRRSNRPAIGVGLCLAVAFGAAAFAGVYSMFSPLGKDYETETDEGTHLGDRRISLEKRYSFASGDLEKALVIRPQWGGGILDIWDDISVAYLSLFCTFCIFGWNMERLGFGNMYVHIATFILFCMAPFWIFTLAALNLDNEMLRGALGVTGICLCAFGLLYGGFWRIQMRKRYNLPSYTSCCGQASVTDCALWLFCCWCSVAQEVRTGNSYDIMEDRFLQKSTISPLPREDAELQSSFSHRNTHPQLEQNQNSLVEEEAMRAPTPPVIHRGDQ